MISAAKKIIYGASVLGMSFIISHCSSNNKATAGMTTPMHDSPLLVKIMKEHPSFFDTIIRAKKDLNVQIIFTQVRRDENHHPVFTDHFFNIDPDSYFYPASTVKFPVALLALQRLNELKQKGVDKYTTMITEAGGDGQTMVTHDLSAANGKPSIAHYIKKIFLVSDNDAFNRLYEFLGQEYINDRLHQMGYRDAQIIHRLSIVLSEEQNRHTNPIAFVDSMGQILYRQPAVKSKLHYAKRDTRLGRGYMQGDELVNAPFDFSQKNRLSLADLHSMMRSVIFPESVSKEKRFNLTEDDYSFLYKYMSMYPGESDFPFYNKNEYPDNYVKKMLPSRDTIPDQYIRVFSKSGTAYGFLTDVAYIVDSIHKIEFFLTATIYCNSDGIFNDNKYDYDAIGYPFLKHLAEAVSEELGIRN